MPATFAAVDLGASSGRVMRAHVDGTGVVLREVHRFVNRPVRVRTTLHWDVLALWSGVLDGLRIAGGDGPLAGIGVDSWGVDYGLLDADGELLATPVHYRDARTDGVVDAVNDIVGARELYDLTGVQRIAINTVYQFAAARETAAMRAATQALLIPDLFGYWLTGVIGCEVTNASTTGMLDVRTRSWSAELAKQLDIRGDLFAPAREPGRLLGPLRDDVAAACGLDAVPVYTVGSHDTASAVLGVPARDADFAYISCGTWSLVGVELDAPITGAAASDANFSNELGVDGTVRFLRNVMGLWLLQESVREWERSGDQVDLERLLAEAAQLPARRSVVDPDRPEFLHPGDMPERLRAECRRTGQPEPTTQAEITRCVLDSLAAAYGRTVHEAAVLSGVRVEAVHVVGGGARNALLCQLTADACGLPVVAGPVEAAAYGNVLVQARAAGVVAGDRSALRALIPAADLVRYEPAS